MFKSPSPTTPRKVPFQETHWPVLEQRMSFSPTPPKMPKAISSYFNLESLTKYTPPAFKKKTRRILGLSPTRKTLPSPKRKAKKKDKAHSIWYALLSTKKSRNPQNCTVDPISDKENANPLMLLPVPEEPPKPLIWRLVGQGGSDSEGSDDESWKEIIDANDERVPFAKRDDFNWGPDANLRSMHETKAREALRFKLSEIYKTKRDRYLMQIEEGGTRVTLFNTLTFRKQVYIASEPFPVGHAVFLTAVSLFISGGGGDEVDPHRLRSLTHTLKLSELQPSHHLFKFHSLAHSHNTLVALGGIGPTGHSSSMTERYEMDKDRWRRCEMMRVQRVRPGSSFIGQYLYAFLGFLRRPEGYNDPVQRIDAATFGRWEPVHLDCSPLRATGVVGLNVIRISKQQVAMFGGVRMKDMFGKSFEEAWEKKHWSKCTERFYVDVRENVWRSLGQKMDLKTQGESVAKLAVIQENKLFFISGERVVMFGPGGWDSFPLI